MLPGAMVDAVRTPEEALAGLPDYPFAQQHRELDGLRLAHIDECMRRMRDRLHRAIDAEGSFEILARPTPSIWRVRMRFLARCATR